MSSDSSVSNEYPFILCMLQSVFLGTLSHALIRILRSIHRCSIIFPFQMYEKHIQTRGGYGFRKVHILHSYNITIGYMRCLFSFVLYSSALQLISYFTNMLLWFCSCFTLIEGMLHSYAYLCLHWCPWILLMGNVYNLMKLYIHKQTSW